MTKYVIYGLGVSGVSAIKYLVRKGEQVIATDDNSKSLVNLKENFKVENPEIVSNVKFLQFEKINFDSETVISFSPGIPLYFPETHKILEIVEKTKAKLVCDIEIFYQKNSRQDFIGITGTNGKSTTASLTDFIFQELNLKAQLGGNIGIPCFDLKDSQDMSASEMTYIFETSSYQLDLIDETHFKIASLLNITPDHLDRHGSLENYIIAKKRILKNQGEGDYSIINVDNSHSKAVFDEFNGDDNFQSKLIPISTKRICESGISIINGILHNRIEGENLDFDLGEVFLKGEHNAENIAVAFAVTYCHLKQQNLLKGFDQERILNIIRKFKGLKHRMQFVGEIDGVNFVNDSKATNAQSSENALKAHENIFWILGGVAKDGGISSLQPYFGKIKKAYLIGEASDEFAEILEKNSVEFEKCDDLQNAVRKSFFDAKKHGLKEKNILLSPACASFDQWKNFEERGDSFCKAFDEIRNF